MPASPGGQAEHKNMNYVYYASIESDPDGGYIVTFPDVPEAITQGEDRGDAVASGADALGMALRGYLAAGRALPRPQASIGTPVAVPAEDAMKLALVEAFRESGMSKTELAARLGKAETEARRILDPDHPTKLATMQAALAALGKTVVITVRDAA